MRNKRSSQRNSYGFTGMFFLNSGIFKKYILKEKRKALQSRMYIKKKGQLKEQDQEG